MDPMLFHSLLRIVHIVAAVFWVGASTLMVFYMFPIANRDDGSNYLVAFFAHSGIGRAMPIASITTTVAGLLMYLLAFVDRPPGLSHIQFFSWLSPTGNIILAIGSIAGLLAFGHGAATISKYTGQYASIGQAVRAGATDQTDDLAATKRLLFLHSRISLGLMLVALFFMSAARYA